MVTINDREGKPAFTVEENEYKFLMRIKNKINQEDSDVVAIYSGNAGSGKSVKAMHHAYVVDPTISMKRICFKQDEFISAVVHANKGEVIIGDEAVSLFFSRASMAKENRIVVEMMAQIRQKNLAIFLCVPEPLMLDWTILKKAHYHSMIWESRHDGTTFKGNQAIYIDLPDYKAKVLLHEYLRKKRNDVMANIKPPQWQIRTKGTPITLKPWYPVNEEAYRNKKESVLEKYKIDPTKKDEPDSFFEKKWQVQRDKAILFIYDNQKKKNISELAKQCDLPRETVKDIIKKYRKNVDRVGFEGGEDANINQICSVEADVSNHSTSQGHPLTQSGEDE